MPARFKTASLSAGLGRVNYRITATNYINLIIILMRHLKQKCPKQSKWLNRICELRFVSFNRQRLKGGYAKTPWERVYSDAHVLLEPTKVTAVYADGDQPSPRDARARAFQLV